MKCEGNESENELSPWWISDDGRLRTESRNPAALALCQPGNLVEKCCPILSNGSSSISFPFKVSISRHLAELREESVCPRLLALMVLINFSPHDSQKAIPTFKVLFTWLVLFCKMQCLFSDLETEPFLAWGFPYLTGRNFLIDFSVPFGSLISICLIDVFPCFWSLFPSFILHMNISSGLSTLFTFSFVICWNLWQEEL